MKTILFPTDFSPTSDEALVFATSMARDMGAKLLIVHVDDSLAAYVRGECFYGLGKPSHDERRRKLDEVVPTDLAVVYEQRLVSGEPAVSIVNLAQREGVELIVMGTHGRSGMSRLLMGSVAAVVARKARCPVITHKQSAKMLASAAG